MLFLSPFHFFTFYDVVFFFQILLVSLLGRECTAYDFGERGWMGRLEGKDMA